MNPKEVIPTLEKHILVDGYHLVVDRAKSKGSWIVDARTGKKYLDCYSQFASQPLGWNHPSLIDKTNDGDFLKSSWHKIANSDMYSTTYAEFVSAFSKITPDFKHYFFIDGGALAVENALKAAFDWKAQILGWENDHDANELNVIHLKDAFHGRSGYTLSLSNTGKPRHFPEENQGRVPPDEAYADMKTKWFPKFNWTRIVNPKTQHKDVQLWEKRSLDAAEITLQKGNVAAIILEPIQGEGGDNHFRPMYFKGLRRLADKYNAMLIFDEVQTGLGLTGRMWAYEHTGVIPDMMCFGKKTQVCGFCATNRIDGVKNNVFVQSGRINSTWGGNITDMERAPIIFDIIKKEKLVENARAVGNCMLKPLAKLDGISNVRGKGLMIAFDLPTVKRRDEVIEKLNKRMMVLKCGEKSIRLRPTLTFSMDDAKLAFKYLKAALK